MQGAKVKLPPGRGPGNLQEVDEARKRRSGLSLKGRALRLLARRDHSRVELRSKLLAHTEDEAALDLLLDDLEGTRLLSDRRFAEVVVQSTGARSGFALVAQTLLRKRVASDLAIEALAPLRVTERERALDICQRRFGKPPVDMKERARQHRFLLGRGFDPGTVSWVLKQCDKGFRDAAIAPEADSDH